MHGIDRRGGRGGTRRAAKLALLIGLWALGACPRTVGAPGQPALVPVLRGPWLLTAAEAGSVEVRWSTEQPAQGRVRWGRFGALDHEQVEPSLSTEHRVRLTGLPAGSRINYEIAGAPPRGGEFATAPAESAPASWFRVLIYGDNRSRGGDHELVARAAASEHPALALHTGDMVTDARREELWTRWFAAEADLLANTQLLPTVGNHEITDQGAFYSSHFQDPDKPTYRSADYGPLHILVLDTYERGAGATPHSPAISDAQVAWAEADLRAVPKDRHVWVLLHNGPYSHPQVARPAHGSDPRILAALVRLRAVHPIEVLFSGHEHFYERGELDGLRYVVVGGGGAPLEAPDPAAPGVQVAREALSYLTVEVCGCHAVAEAKDVAGATFDRFLLADCPQACPGLPAPP